MWFDEVEIGAVTALGEHHFDADAIVRFARAYDPQPFHVSEAAGKASLFGGLAASGWHTASVWQLKLSEYEATLRAQAGARGEVLPATVFSPDIRDLRWMKPVIAGDTIRFRLTVGAKSASDANPGWGEVTLLGEGLNQRDELAFQLTIQQFLALKG